MRRPASIELLLAQLLRFGLVGLLATAVHAAAYGVAVSRAAVPPLLANPLAFVAAFVISFVGHHRWTFAGHGAEYAIPRFFATALLGLAVNQFMVWLLVERLGLPPLSALFSIVLLVPALVFIASRYWAFAAPDPARSAAD